MPLRHSAQRNSITTDSFFEQMADAACIAGADGSLCYVNRAFLRCLGFGEGEVLELRLETLFAGPADYGQVQRSIEQHDVVRDVGVWVRHKNGYLIHCLVSITVERDTNGSVVAYHIVLRETSNGHFVADNLDVAQLPLHSTLEQVDVSIFVIEDGILRYLDAKMAQIFQYEPDELVGRLGLLDLIYPADRSRVGAQLSHCLEGRAESFRFHFRGLAKDGSVLHCRTAGRRVEQGEARALMGTIVDETERWQVEAALGESQRTLSILMSNLPGMVYRCHNDEMGTIEFVSEGAFELTGYLPIEFMRNKRITFADIVLPEDRERVWAEAREAVAEGRPFQLTYRLRTREGEIRWVWEKGRGVRLPNGEPRIEGFITDISHLKYTEKQVYQNAARATALAKAAERLNAQLDFGAVLRVMCEETAKALDVPVTILRLYDTENDVFTVEAVYGLPWSYRQASRPLPGVLHEQLRATGPLVLPDIQAFPELSDHELYLKHELRTAVITTIGRSGTLLGLLTALTREMREFGEDELALITALGNHASQAITSVRLYEQAQRRLRRLQALNAIDRAITSRIGLDAALATILEQVVTHLEVDAATVHLFDKEAQALTHTADRGFRTLRMRRTRVQLDRSYPGRAVLSRKTVHVRDLSKVDDFTRHPLLAAEGFVGYAGLPLVTEDKVIGVLEIFHRSPLNPGSEWFAFAESLAIQTAVAVDSATLFAETRRLLQQTQVQAEQIRQIVDTVPEGMILLDSAYRIRMANPLGQRYLEELAGAVVNDALMHLGGVPLSRILESASPTKRWYELYIREERRIFEIAAEQLHEGPGAGGWVLVIYDATQERERTQRLQTQERLATVGKLAAGIAHDFNNILGVVQLQAEALQQNIHDDKDKKRLKIIDEQAQQAGRMVRQILDFSRQSIIDRHALPLLTFLENMVELLQRALPENIQVQFLAEDSDNDHYLVSVDETRLQQVMMNLAINARDAMRDGGSLTIRLRQLYIGEHDKPPLPEMLPGDWVEISVSDTGTGISSEDIPHIFEPFFTMKARGEGTGLGLSQVYGIVRQHDGYIDVRSRLNHGTTFSVYLPSIYSDEDDFTEPEAKLAVEGGDETVLVVEDNAFVRESLADILGSLGYHVLTANDGREALDCIQSQEHYINAVISDLVMPHMGGTELHAALKERYPAIPMLFVTGYAPSTEAQLFLSREDVTWIQKPFSLETVAAAVRGIIDRS